jgi:hypothetical protein
VRVVGSKTCQSDRPWGRLRLLAFGNWLYHCANLHKAGKYTPFHPSLPRPCSAITPPSLLGVVLQSSNCKITTAPYSLMVTVSNLSLSACAPLTVGSHHPRAFDWS